MGNMDGFDRMYPADERDPLEPPEPPVQRRGTIIILAIFALAVAIVATGAAFYR